MLHNEIFYLHNTINHTQTDSINIYITGNILLLLQQGIGEVHRKYRHQINYQMFRHGRQLLFTHHGQYKLLKL